MGKQQAASCDETSRLKKGPWTADEDQKLVDYIQKNGHGRWRTLPKNAGLQRCGKSCRLRWTNYLRPDIKRGKFSPEEEETIIHLHSLLGNKWSAIAARLPGRTDNEIKNYWNTHIRKRLLRLGIDPMTHGPRFDLLDLSFHNSSSATLALGSTNPSEYDLQLLYNHNLSQYYSHHNYNEHHFHQLTRSNIVNTNAFNAVASTAAGLLYDGDDTDDDKVQQYFLSKIPQNAQLLHHQHHNQSILLQSQHYDKPQPLDMQHNNQFEHPDFQALSTRSSAISSTSFGLSYKQDGQENQFAPNPISACTTDGAAATCLAQSFSSFPCYHNDQYDYRSNHDSGRTGFGGESASSSTKALYSSSTAYVGNTSSSIPEGDNRCSNGMMMMFDHAFHSLN